MCNIINTKYFAFSPISNLGLIFYFYQKYFQSGPFKTQRNDAGKTFLEIEWTNQHGCGGNEDTNPQKQNCQMILQYMCQDDVNSPTGNVLKQDTRNPVNSQLHLRFNFLNSKKITLHVVGSIILEMGLIVIKTVIVCREFVFK